jgi:hypothetical protein
MGTYHTFFVATDDELDRLFPGWKRVRPEQGQVEQYNPFTKTKMIVNDWVPLEAPAPLGKPSLHDDVWGARVEPIVPVENDYMASIEEACAPGLRARPHFRAKNYDPFLELEPLVAALVGAKTAVPPARLGPEGDDDVPVVWALPDAAAKVLAALDDAKLPSVMEQLFADEESLAEDDSEEARDYFADRARVPLLRLALLTERDALLRAGATLPSPELSGELEEVVVEVDLHRVAFRLHVAGPHLRGVFGDSTVHLAA